MQNTYRLILGSLDANNQFWIVNLHIFSNFFLLFIGGHFKISKNKIHEKESGFVDLGLLVEMSSGFQIQIGKQ